ncbi:odorant receptor 67c [Tribolium castaneum]|uniref:Odorant receptor n=1 Tax=Tribolium castaneum TaxID=7070 RepID=D6WZ99_TRICA|nr:PREDICTED: odorant receptor 67c [Tribolium castaneum]EFA10779.1 odorant receptor 76 [Tribolium castaneum]|eukprot:XP_008197944.1 PREDICTED: odorant receptor 67c [Tribolium castaneum]
MMESTVTRLKRMYLWPTASVTSRKPAFFLITFSCFLLYGSVMHLIVNDISMEEVHVIETTAGQFGVLYYLTLFTIYRKGILEIYADLSNFTKFGKPYNFDKRNKQLNQWSRWFSVVLYFFVISVFAWPGIFTQSCEDLNVALNKTEVCGVVSPVWLPFRFDYKPMKQFVYFWQSFCCLYSNGGAGTISFAMSETIEHLILRVEDLKILFPKIVAERSPEVRRKMLAKWVDYHLWLLSIGKLMNDTYRYSFSVIVLCAGTLFGCIGYTVMKNASTNFNSSFIFFGWMESVFVICVCGQRLMDAFHSVGTTVYNSEWCDTDVDFQKGVILITIRAQKPVRIYAGPFSYVSHLLILTVFQTSYSYINLLNASS